MDSLKSYLSQKLKEQLPGKKAHIEAVPYRKVDYGTFDMENARKSAVLILFYLKQNEPYIVLIQRPEYDGTHGGQIALPGGKVEDSDKDIFYTAVREAHEEVGIILDDVEVMGRLTDMFIPVSNFLVTPVIGFINYAPNFIPEPKEVAEIIELKLTDLTDVKELSLNKIKLKSGLNLEVPTFELNQKIVWGATAIILNELRHILMDWEN